MLDILFDPIGSITNMIPAWAWWLLGFFAVTFIIGLLWRLKDILVLIHKIAGWPGVAGIVGIIVTLIAVIWPREQLKQEKIVKYNETKYPIPFPYRVFNGRRLVNGRWQKFNQTTGEWDNV